MLFFQFAFKSYSVEDDDYEGYDYSLTGHLSAVRLVFLYRFIQEVSWNFEPIPSNLLAIGNLLFLYRVNCKVVNLEFFLFLFVYVYEHFRVECF